MSTTRTTTYTIATAATELERIITAYSLLDTLDDLLHTDHPDVSADRAIAMTALDTIRAAQVELGNLDAIEQARQQALDLIVDTKRRLDALTGAPHLPILWRTRRAYPRNIKRVEMSELRCR